MLYKTLICFLILLCLASGKEGKEDQKEIYNIFCDNLNLRLHVTPDYEKCTLGVYFELTNSSHIVCFDFLDIVLKIEEKKLYNFMVKYNNTEGFAEHTFQNVTSGVYNVTIVPTCISMKCPDFIIGYKKLITMSSDTCTSNRSEILRTSVTSKIHLPFIISETQTSSVQTQASSVQTQTSSIEMQTSSVQTQTSSVKTHTSSIASKIHPTFLTKVAYTSSIYEVHTFLPNETETTFIDKMYKREYQKDDVEQRTVVIIVVVSPILVLIICGMIYFARRKKHSMNRIPDITADHKNNDTHVLINTHTDIEVYIFHYYDSKEKMKKKVEILKDFLLKLSYFSCVKVVEEELSVILFNVDNWMNDLLDENRNVGTVKRLILITSQEENEPYYNDEIENQVYSAFLKKINNKDEQCFTGNDNVYFVQLDNSVRLENNNWQHQYSLYGEPMLNHMMDLCIDLCSGLKLDTHLIKERIKELFMKHPVRHLGKSLNFIECV